MNATNAEETKKPRGDLQLIALDIINKIEEDYVFETLTRDVGAACFPNHPEAEPKARHLIRYLVKYQDRIAPGKVCTLRSQGRVVAPTWYTPVAVDKNVSKDDVRYKEHMAAVIEMGNENDKNPIRSRTEVSYLDFPLKAPNGRKKSDKPATTVTSTKPEKNSAATPERKDLIKAVAQNFQAKQATKRMKELANAAASKFAAPTVTPVEAPTETSATVETEQA